MAAIVYNTRFDYGRHYNNAASEIRQDVEPVVAPEPIKAKNSAGVDYTPWIIGALLVIGGVIIYRNFKHKK